MDPSPYLEPQELHTFLPSCVQSPPIHHQFQLNYFYPLTGWAPGKKCSPFIQSVWVPVLPQNQGQLGALLPQLSWGVKEILQFGVGLNYLEGQDPCSFQFSKSPKQKLEITLLIFCTTVKQQGICLSEADNLTSKFWNLFFDIKTFQMKSNSCISFLHHLFESGSNLTQD